MNVIKRFIVATVLCLAVISVSFVSCSGNEFTGVWNYENSIIDLDMKVVFDDENITITSRTGAETCISAGKYRQEGKTLYITMESVSKDGETFTLIPQEKQQEIASRYYIEGDGTLLIEEMGYPLLKD